MDKKNKMLLLYNCLKIKNENFIIQ